MKKTLMIVQNKDNYFFQFVKQEDIDIVDAYTGDSLLHKIIRKIPLLASLVYGSWKSSLDLYSRIIVYDSIYNKTLGNYLKNHTAHKNIFIYCWNTAIDNKQKKLLKNAKKMFPVYSFDRKDCERYKLNYASMVYSSDALSKKAPSRYEYDVIFVGKDKGRVDYLFQIYKSLKEQKFRPYFYILGEERKEYTAEDFVFGKKYLSYNENVRLINASRAILDIQQDGQEGITLRIVEAMFYEKKIITNKLDINEYDFYSDNNIFILNKNDIMNISEFLNSKFKAIPKEVIDRYDLKYWKEYYFN